MARRILITGSSRGIGKAVALNLARDGFAATVHCRQRIDEARAVVEEARAQGGEAEVMSFDVRDRAQCRALLEEDIARRGPYYGIVLNAGISRDGPFAGFSEQDWDDVLRTDLDAFYNVLHPLLLPMISARQGGRIITMASASGLIGNRGQVNYSAAKAGLIGATKALAKEVAKRRITVNAVAPGLIETDMIIDAPQEEMLKLIPMGRLGKPEEVAALVSFLCSDSAGYISGQVISVNGALV